MSDLNFELSNNYNIFFHNKINNIIQNLNVINKILKTNLIDLNIKRMSYFDIH